MLLAGRDTRILFSKPVEILADIPRCDVDEFQTVPFSPREKKFDRVQVRGARVRVANPTIEKFFCREYCRRACARNNSR